MDIKRINESSPLEAKPDLISSRHNFIAMHNVRGGSNYIYLYLLVWFCVGLKFNMFISTF
jgi:hypothetical protein